MGPRPRQRQVNPRLGAYYGIVASAVISLLICLAMLEQFGWSRGALAEALIFVPLGLYLAIALGARTLNVEDFFASGRRVPPVYNGAVLAAVLVGGAGFFGYTGTLFFLGFDGLAIGLAWTTGLLLAGLLFVPYLRKAGAYTLPAFLGQRFRSRSVRVVASLLQLPPAALLLAAEIKIAALMAALFLTISYQLAIAAVAIIIAFITIVGGMRSLTWSATAQFIVGAIGLAIPLIIVSVLMTNLPTPQLTYGEMFAPLTRSETIAGISPSAPQLTAALPAEQLKPSTKPFLQPFGAISRIDFVMLFLCLTLGTAALPSLLVRSGVTGSVADQRRSVAWAALFVALFAASAPSIAAFVRLLMFQDIAQAPASALPSWLNDLNLYRLILVQDANGDGTIQASELLVARDGIALALPMAGRLPFVCTVLVAAGGMAIALAAAASHLFTIAGSVADDVVIRLADPQGEVLPRLMTAWVVIAATALGAAVFLAFANIDLMHASVMALSFAAATFFPVLLLAIWWRRCTWLGALLALGLGFGVAILEIAFGARLGSSYGHLTTVIAALIGVTLGLIGGLMGGLLGPQPSVAEANYFEELRDPGGEALYDRARQRSTAAAQ
jgi:cation/acetate symporter